jgi:hypothetical protein
MVGRVERNIDGARNLDTTSVEIAFTLKRRDMQSQVLDHCVGEYTQS